jgi:hypothetical protein
MMGFVGPLRRLALSVFYRSGRRGAQRNFPRPLAGEGGAQPKAGRVRARAVTDGGFNRLSDLIDSGFNPDYPLGIFHAQAEGWLGGVCP